MFSWVSKSHCCTHNLHCWRVWGQFCCLFVARCNPKMQQLWGLEKLRTSAQVLSTRRSLVMYQLGTDTMGGMFRRPLTMRGFKTAGAVMTMPRKVLVEVEGHSSYGGKWKSSTIWWSTTFCQSIWETMSSFCDTIGPIGLCEKHFGACSLFTMRLSIYGRKLIITCHAFYWTCKACQLGNR